MNEVEETIELETEDSLVDPNNINIDSSIEDELLKFNEGESLEGSFTSYLLIGSDE